jgi:DNA-binding MarR family transcriptional regulator
MPTPAAAPTDGVETNDADPRREAWQLVGRLLAEFKSRMGETVREFGLAPMQVGALLHLDPDGPPVPMSRLAEILHCDNSNVTGIVDRLEAAGLVERRPFEGDRRVKAVALTGRGKSVRPLVQQRFSTPPPSISSLDDDDAVALRDILQRALGPSDR